MISFEEELLQYFTEIVYVDSNPYTSITIEKYKDNDEFKTRTIKRILNLEVCDCFNFKQLIDHILDKIIKESKSIKIDYYPKSFIQRIFKSKKSNLKIEVEKYNSDNYLLIGPCLILNQINSGNKLISEIGNQIIVGKRPTTLHLQLQENRIISFSIEIDDFSTIKLV